MAINFDEIRKRNGIELNNESALSIIELKKQEYDAIKHENYISEIFDTEKHKKNFLEADSEASFQTNLKNWATSVNDVWQQKAVIDSLDPDTDTANMSENQIHSMYQDLVSRLAQTEQEYYDEWLSASNAYETAKKVKEKGYLDTKYSSSWTANYTLADINENKLDAAYRYVLRPNKANMLSVEMWVIAEQEFIKNNHNVGKGGLISNTLASHLPEQINQVKERIKGGIIGLIGGAMVGLPKAGIIAGQSVAAGLESFKKIQGATYLRLRELGVTEDTALTLAKSEAFVSGLIESLEAGVDFLTLGLGKWATLAAKFGINILTEVGQEIGQEAVSIGTEYTAAKKDGFYYTPSFKENMVRLYDTGKEAAKTAFVMGGADVAFSTTATKVGGQIYNKTKNLPYNTKNIFTNTKNDIFQKGNNPKSLESRAYEAYLSENKDTTKARKVDIARLAYETKLKDVKGNAISGDNGSKAYGDYLNRSIDNVVNNGIIEGDGKGKGISQNDRQKLQSWKYTPDESTYLKYKKVYDNPKYFDQFTGEINWPSNDGFKKAPHETILRPGMRIDRFGYDTGFFASPEGTDYLKRSLVPGSENKPYSVFEVIKPINVKEGEIASWFDEIGGGIQYLLPQSIDGLLESNIIRRVK